MPFPTKTVKARWRLTEEARERLLGLPPDADDQEIIAAATDYLIAQVHGGKWHLSILDADQSVEYDWKYKNVYGVTTKDPERARAWISTCMRRGYCVFSSRAKRGTGAGPGNIALIHKRIAEQIERADLGKYGILTP